MTVIVRLFPPRMVDLVSRELQSAFHCLVAHPPVTDLRAPHPLVVGTIHHENADRLGFSFAHENRVSVPAPHTNKRTDGSENASKGVRAFPRQGERPDSAGAGAANGAIIWISR